MNEQERIKALEGEVMRLWFTLSYRICNCKTINRELDQNRLLPAEHHERCPFAVIMQSARVPADSIVIDDPTLSGGGLKRSAEGTT